MRRRAFLRRGAGTVAAGSLAAIPPRSIGARQGADDLEPLGWTAVEGAKDAATDDDGEVAYVAATDGFAVVDVSDPAAPELLAERRDLLENREGGPLQEIWDVWPDGDRLAVVGPAQAIAGSDFAGAVLFDVSDPADPQFLDFYRLDEGFVHNCFFEDGVLYLTGNDIEGEPLILLDAGGDDLSELGRWSLLDHDPDWAEVPWPNRQLHDVYVDDGVAYLPYWDAGTWLLDVSDPAAPEYLGRVAQWDREELAALTTEAARREVLIPPGNDHYVEVGDDGDLLAVGREAWAVETDGGIAGGPGEIDLYDVSDLEAPAHLATIDPPASDDQTRGGRFTTSHNFDLAGDRLYASWYFGGVRTYDVSDPEDPRELARWSDPDEAVFWTARVAIPGETFVASSADDGGGFEPDVEGRLYVFPADRADSGRPSTDEPDSGGDEADSGEPARPDGSADDELADRSEDDSTEGDRNGAAATPGFGPAVGLAGVGVATWRLVRGRTSAGDPSERE